MQNALPWILFFIPTLPFLVTLLPARSSATAPGRAATLAAGAALALSFSGTLLLAFFGPGQWRWSPFSADSPVALTLRLDAVSMTMALLVSFVGLAVIRFSKNYLAGDPHQAGFFRWIHATLGSVLLLVISGNLLVLWLAWASTSLCLHRLLIFYPDRSAALFAARKKFVFSRLGDVCLLAAFWVIYREFGTLEMDRLFAAVENGQTQGLALTGWLFVACAMLKSAQFPFHGWLPDTMETPTPVSAFMHAGIINAGGFLLIRLSPLLGVAGSALNFLAVIGALTAAFGAVVMLAQPGVKRALAFSTVAQMGFMLLQCGLGAFGLALLHIVAHSLYKAHAFLRSGSTIGALPRAAVPLHSAHLLAGLAVGGVTTFSALWLVQKWMAAPAPAVLALVTALALAYGVARICSVRPGLLRVVLACLGSLLAAVLVFVLHGLAGFLYPDLPKWQPSTPISLLVGGVFIALFLIQSLLWRLGRSAFGRKFYIHALNGFYVGTWGNRLLNRLWPPHPVGLPRSASADGTPNLAAPSPENAIS